MPSSRTRWAPASTVIPVGPRRADRRSRARRDPRRGPGAGRDPAGQQRDRHPPAARPPRAAHPRSRVRCCSPTARRAPASCRFPTPISSRLSAHKLGGPPGIGALLVRDLATLEPVGGQEKGYRRGTQDVPGALGFAAALDRQALRHGAPCQPSRRASTRASAAAGGVVIGEDSPRLADHRRGRAAGRVERLAAGPVRPRRHRGVGGQRLLVGQDEGKRACSRRWASRRDVAGSVPADQLRPAHQRSRRRRLPCRMAAHRAPRSRGGMIYLDYQATTPVAPEVVGGDAAVDRGEVRQSAQPVALGPRGRRGDRGRARRSRAAHRPRRRPLRLHRRRDRGAQLGAQGHLRTAAASGGASWSPSPPNMPRCSTPPNGSKGRGVEVVRLPVGADGLIDLATAEAAIDAIDRAGRGDAGQQ